MLVFEGSPLEQIQDLGIFQHPATSLNLGLCPVWSTWKLELIQLWAHHLGSIWNQYLGLWGHNWTAGAQSFLFCWLYGKETFICAPQQALHGRLGASAEGRGNGIPLTCQGRVVAASSGMLGVSGQWSGGWLGTAVPVLPSLADRWNLLSDSVAFSSWLRGEGRNGLLQSRPLQSSLCGTEGPLLPGSKQHVGVCMCVQGGNAPAKQWTCPNKQKAKNSLSSPLEKPCSRCGQWLEVLVGNPADNYWQQGNTWQQAAARRGPSLFTEITGISVCSVLMEKHRPVREGSEQSCLLLLARLRACCVASSKLPLSSVLQFLLLCIEVRDGKVLPWGFVAKLLNSARCFVAGMHCVWNR